MVEGFDVPLVLVWGECVILTGVLSKFSIPSKVWHGFDALFFCPHKAHGEVTCMVGVSCMMGSLSI